ncbi:MAG: ribonuclease HI [Actinobacteria bacterium]|nr:MAG: ribonuclease HI [Actinomycetota bacterium]
MPRFTCETCGASFSLPQTVLERYPGWVPRQCRDCRGNPRPRSGGGASPVGTDPESGVFTDGGASPNPGPGGWGAVYVVAGAVVAEASGHDPDTTNNRMELTALIEGMRLVPEGTSATIYSDSNLVVRTIKEWAPGWERRGWRRKSGPVENLDLVKPAYQSFRARPELSLQWVKAHAGITWNEYADRLANAWREGR